jgi:cysteinyl-tRNA synthetase
MAMHLLGDTIDVHSGGSDLVFPHHESEIAQAEGASGVEPFVRCWLHTAMVHHEGEKMSKSLGNLVMVDDLLEDWSPDALRLYLARHHYREVWSHNLAELEQAQKLARWLTDVATAGGGTGASPDCASLRDAFAEAMDDDLDTPRAIHQVERLAELILDAAGSGQDVRSAQAMLRAVGSVLGLRLDAAGPETPVGGRWSQYLESFK